MSGTDRLRWSTIAVYGLPAAGIGFMENLISFYLLKFSTDVLLVSPALMGLFFGLSRVWDAISDPVVGYWSDRTRSALGRRRPWFAGSVVPLAAVFLALWMPPAGLGSVWLAAWMGAGVVLFFTAQTAFAVPHLALGAELTRDSHDRTRVFAGRLALSLIGVICAAGGLGLLERADDPRVTAGWVAVAGAGVMIATTVWAIARLRERPELAGRAGRSAYTAFGDVLRNRHARVLLGVLFLEALGFAAMTTTMPFATQYLFELPGMASVLMASALGVMGASVPLWLWLERLYGKKRVWLSSLVLRAAAFASMLFVEPGSALPIVVNVVVIGAAFGCGAMLGPSIKADVIDDDEVNTGERKEGTYFASWNLASKCASGVAIMLSGAVLELVGFAPNVGQSPSALWGILALFAGFPCVFYLLAALLLARLALYRGGVG